MKKTQFSCLCSILWAAGIRLETKLHQFDHTLVLCVNAFIPPMPKILIANTELSKQRTLKKSVTSSGILLYIMGTIATLH